MQTLTVVSPSIQLRKGDILEYQNAGTIRQARVMRQTHPDGGYVAITGSREVQPAILDETNIIRLVHARI